MIIVRSPLRISLGGGGTDLPSYYRQRDCGFLIAAAIDKYVYITLHETFQPEIILKYSKLEHVLQPNEVQHPIVREALKLVGLTNFSIEIASMADIPAGTGLGSSGSFTTALLKALHTHEKHIIHPSQLAAEACEIEINQLREPIGKQDQYIAAFGGLTCFQFLPDETVQASPLRTSAETLHNLEDNLILFYTGVTRSASLILKDQHEKSKNNDRGMLENLDFIKGLAKETQSALEQGDLRRFAELMNVHWERKRARSSAISSDGIDGLYQLGRNHGALGGKLIGAGGGGFLMFYTEDKTALRSAMTKAGLREVRFRFDFEGTKVLVQ